MKPPKKSLEKSLLEGLRTTRLPMADLHDDPSSTERSDASATGSTRSVEQQTEATLQELKQAYPKLSEEVLRRVAEL